MDDPRIDAITDIFETLMLNEATLVRLMKEDVRRRIVSGDFDGAVNQIMQWAFVTGVMVGRGDLKID